MRVRRPSVFAVLLTVCGVAVFCALGVWQLRRAAYKETVLARFHDAYDGEPLVRVLDEAPWVSCIAGRHHAEIGGFAMSADGRRVVVVATLDNLLKGAATHAMQNINRAIGVDECTAITLERE